MPKLTEAQTFAKQVLAGHHPEAHEWMKVDVTIQCSAAPRCARGNNDPHERAPHEVNADLIVRSMCHCGAPNNLTIHWDPEDPPGDEPVPSESE